MSYSLEGKLLATMSSSKGIYCEGMTQVVVLREDLHSDHISHRVHKELPIPNLSSMGCACHCSYDCVDLCPTCRQDTCSNPGEYILDA